MAMTAQELEALQAREYGTYVAVRAIDIDGARAFNVGDPVPASHVDGGVVAADAVKSTESAPTKKG